MSRDGDFHLISEVFDHLYKRVIRGQLLGHLYSQYQVTGDL